MSKRTHARWLVAACALCVAASGCLGGHVDLGAQARTQSSQSANGVKPPDQVDPKATAQPGLILSTNSRTWQKLVDARSGPGAVILFVQPGGPSDGKGIARGDVLTAIDGTSVKNHEAGIALLRSRAGQKRDLKLVQRDGTVRTVTIEARNPRGAQVRGFLNPMIEASGSDPVLHFLRAQAAGGTFGSNLADVNQAIAEKPDFVEALTLKASLQWDHRLADRGHAVDLVNQALAGWKNALDVDPNSATTLSVRSTAYTTLGRGALGKADAMKALSLDDSYARGYYAESFALIELRDTKGALGPAAAAVKLDPYNYQYFTLLAAVFRQLGRKADCLKTADAMSSFLNANNLGSAASGLRDICA